MVFSPYTIKPDILSKTFQNAKNNYREKIIYTIQLSVLFNSISSLKLTFISDSYIDLSLSKRPQ